MSWSGGIKLGLGAVPALVILLMRHDLPETAVWLIRHGRFREAKQVAMSMYSDRLEMLPDQDIVVEKPKPSAFLADLKKDPIRLARDAVWLHCLLLPGRRVLDLRILSAGDLPAGWRVVAAGNNLVLMALFTLAAVSGVGRPMITPRIGQRGIAIARFAIVLVACWSRRAQLYAGINWLLPIAAAAMLWAIIGTRPIA